MFILYFIELLSTIDKVAYGFMGVAVKPPTLGGGYKATP